MSTKIYGTSLHQYYTPSRYNNMSQASSNELPPCGPYNLIDSKQTFREFAYSSLKKDKINDLHIMEAVRTRMMITKDLVLNAVNYLIFFSNAFDRSNVSVFKGVPLLQPCSRE